MIKKNININLLNGFHIRPATKFVKKARKFSSKIKIKLRNKIIDAKSLFKIQTLGISYGDVITIIADGKDEKDAVNYLFNLINSFKE